MAFERDRSNSQLHFEETICLAKTEIKETMQQNFAQLQEELGQLTSEWKKENACLRAQWMETLNSLESKIERSDAKLEQLLSLSSLKAQAPEFPSTLDLLNKMEEVIQKLEANKFEGKLALDQSPHVTGKRPPLEIRFDDLWEQEEAWLVSTHTSATCDVPPFCVEFKSKKHKV
eukprot:TRINITY_DN2893_c0_g1_i3.p1 TRINITY_DN2893_c0_g1~~TRINITY_DN2893_c0_g1_i3.p1  ORF type:complete len:174 (-),score=41.42 TRINITY_DN2893_c0_g1_i3:64-585(-)